MRVTTAGGQRANNDQTLRWTLTDHHQPLGPDFHPVVFPQKKSNPRIYFLTKNLAIDGFLCEKYSFKVSFHVRARVGLC